jgi:protein involved in polysaccharide export with SLBB domain
MKQPNHNPASILSDARRPKLVPDCRRNLTAVSLRLLCAALWLIPGRPGWANDDAGPLRPAPPTGLQIVAVGGGALPSSAPAANDSAKPVSVVKPPPANPKPMDVLDDKQKLGVGDRVTFRVLEDEEPAKPLTITDSGELDVPELGLVKAAGKTCKQLAFELRERLEQVTYYHATVILGVDLLNKTMSGRRVYVAGEVRHAGPQEIPAGETWTVTKAIMRAGGFTEYADRKKVRVVRGGNQGQHGHTLNVNVVDVLEKGKTEVDVAVEPEDVIYVPARALNFY